MTFEDCWRLHYRKLVGDLIQFGRLPQDAEELAGDALRKSWPRIAEMPPARQWVYVRTAARHEAINHRRRETAQRRDTGLNTPLDEARNARYRRTPEDEAIAREAIAALRDNLRAVLADRAVEKTTPSRSAFMQLTDAEADAAIAAQERRFMAAQDRMIEEFGTRTPEEVAAAGIPAGAVLTVRYHDTDVIPGFQFDEQGRLLPVFAEAFAILRTVRSPWEIALWFMGANGWLDGDRPVDALRTDPDDVIEAARRQAEELVF